MINKKKFLGKNPDDVGIKDAIHVAIVSVLAGSAIQTGSRVKLNNDGHAVCASGREGFGVADPFVGTVARGDRFWVLIDPDKVDTVSHTWEMNLQFPTTVPEVKKNRTIQEVADAIGVKYEDLMQACTSYVNTDRKSPYPGMKTVDEVEAAVEEIELYELWSEWSEETGYEFYNIGSECCPEYEYPGCIPFEHV